MTEGGREGGREGRNRGENKTYPPPRGYVIINLELQGIIYPTKVV